MAGDRGMVAAALYRLGRVNLHLEHPSDALRALQLGQMAAQDVGSYADLARLHLSAGWAYALLGQPQRMTDSFSRAEHELGLALAGGTVSPWAAGFVRSGDLGGVRATGHTILSRGSGPAAVSHAETATEIAARNVTTPADDRPAR